MRSKRREQYSALAAALGCRTSWYATADDVYVRFHGTKTWYRHEYSDDELLIWAERIFASGAKTAWVYFNNDRDGYSIKSATRLAKLLRA
jgi:uncharacterized protein YecE (DUF72 family)